MKVIRDGESRWRFVYWDVLSQEFPIAKGHPARAIHAHNILVILANFDYNTCLVTLGGVTASLVLYAHVMTNFKRGKLSCVFVPTVS